MQRLLLIFLTGIVGIFLILPLIGLLTALYPQRIYSVKTPADFGLSFETVRFETADNVTLAGWFIPAEIRDAPTLILLHGYPADKGNILRMSFLADRYNLFLFDFRSFGESGGKRSGAGAYEVQDVHAALQFLEREKNIQNVGVWGFSMGGSVALMAAAEYDAIQAVVADTPYSRLDRMAHELYRIPVLRHPLGFLTSVWARIILGIDLRSVSPQDAARNTDASILLIHSQDDAVIPFSHAQYIQNALEHNTHAHTWFPEERPHGQLDQVYFDRVESFFDDYL